MIIYAGIHYIQWDPYCIILVTDTPSKTRKKEKKKALAFLVPYFKAQYC